MAWTNPRTWIVGEIVTAALLNTHVRDNLLAVTPAGAMLDYGGAAAPSGWLLCDGTAASRTVYAALFAAIGTVYGVGDGTTTFNLPDFQGRMAVGKGTHADVDSLGESDGYVLADRRPKHKHTVNDAGHNHPTDDGSPFLHYTNAGSDNVGGDGVALESALTTGNSVTGVTVGPQTNVPVDAPAYLVVNKIIKI